MAVNLSSAKIYLKNLKFERPLLCRFVFGVLQNNVIVVLCCVMLYYIIYYILATDRRTNRRANRWITPMH